jgi:hypothetical protein
MLENNDIMLSTVEVSSDDPIDDQITAQNASSDALQTLVKRTARQIIDRFSGLHWFFIPPRLLFNTHSPDMVAAV